MQFCEQARSGVIVDQEKAEADGGLDLHPEVRRQ